MTRNYQSAADAARILGVSDRTVRSYAEKYEWFGCKLGHSETWVFTKDEIDRMFILPRPGRGRPKKIKPVEPVESVE